MTQSVELEGHVMPGIGFDCEIIFFKQLRCDCKFKVNDKRHVRIFTKDITDRLGKVVGYSCCGIYSFIRIQDKRKDVL